MPYYIDRVFIKRLVELFMHLQDARAVVPGAK